MASQPIRTQENQANQSPKNNSSFNQGWKTQKEKKTQSSMLRFDVFRKINFISWYISLSFLKNVRNVPKIIILVFYFQGNIDEPTEIILARKSYVKQHTYYRNSWRKETKQTIMCANCGSLFISCNKKVQPSKKLWSRMES